MNATFTRCACKRDTQIKLLVALQWGGVLKVLKLGSLISPLPFLMEEINKEEALDFVNFVETRNALPSTTVSK